MGRSKGSWLTVVALLLCVITLVAVLVPVVQAARDAARRMQSTNNLRQLSLAVSNYKDTMRRFPRGAICNADNVPVLGWLVTIQPYLEASSWSYRVDQTVAYDHPSQYFRFLDPMPTLQHPGIVESFTVDGFALTHYLSNPHIMSLRPALKNTELFAGESHTWLFGVASGNYQPMGYAYNWRPLTWPIAGDANSYGWKNSAQFSMVDGSVQTLSYSTDRVIVELFANAQPPAAAEEMARPKIKFRLTDSSARRKRQWFKGKWRQENKGDPYSIITFAQDGRTAEVAEVISPSEQVLNSALDLDDIIKRYATVSVLEMPRLTDPAAELITALPNLHTIVCYDLELSSIGYVALRRLPKLKLISVTISRQEDEVALRQQAAVATLQSELTSVEIHTRSR